MSFLLFPLVNIFVRFPLVFFLPKMLYYYHFISVVIAKNWGEDIIHNLLIPLSVLLSILFIDFYSFIELFRVLFTSYFSSLFPSPLYLSSSPKQNMISGIFSNSTHRVYRLKIANLSFYNSPDPNLIFPHHVLFSLFPSLFVTSFH